MNENFSTTKTTSIQEAGYTEKWLQDEICKSPSILKLGELEFVTREKIQESGGKLDIQLINKDEDTMYEVEVMLGATDANHIIRTIEYWDNEKRVFQKKAHIPVLIAEIITKRFFNVISLFSHSIPIIAIQVSLIELEGKRALHFSKVLDSYQETQEIEQTAVSISEGDWRQDSPATLEMAKTALELLKQIFPEAKLNYVQSYVALVVNGNNYITFRTRDAGKSEVRLWLTEARTKIAGDILNGVSMPFKLKRNQHLCFTTDSKWLKEHADAFSKVAQLSKESWQEI
jgi:hypothetical protein